MVGLSKARHMVTIEAHVGLRKAYVYLVTLWRPQSGGGEARMFSDCSMGGWCVACRGPQCGICLLELGMPESLSAGPHGRVKVRFWVWEPQATARVGRELRVGRTATGLFSGGCLSLIAVPTGIPECQR